MMARAVARLPSLVLLLSIRAADADVEGIFYTCDLPEPLGVSDLGPSRLVKSWSDTELIRWKLAEAGIARCAGGAENGVSASDVNVTALTPWDSNVEILYDNNALAEVQVEFKYYIKTSPSNDPAIKRSLGSAGIPSNGDKNSQGEDYEVHDREKCIIRQPGDPPVAGFTADKDRVCPPPLRGHQSGSSGLIAAAVGALFVCIAALVVCGLKAAPKIRPAPAP